MTVAQDAIQALKDLQGTPDSITPTVLTDAITAVYDELRSNTGHAAYNDSVHVDLQSAFTVSANTDTILPNNAGIVYNAQKPAYFGDQEFYENGKITGRNGDNLDIMIYFKATPTTNNQFIEVWVDIGGTVGELYRLTESFPRGANTERSILYPLPSAYTRGTFETNGGTVYVRSNAAVSIHGISFNFDTSHRALPEV